MGIYISGLLPLPTDSCSMPWVRFGRSFQLMAVTKVLLNRGDDRGKGESHLPKVGIVETKIQKQVFAQIKFCEYCLFLKPALLNENMCFKNIQTGNRLVLL